MTEIPARGDRSAWDSTNYPDKHAKDIEDDTYAVHVPAPVSDGQTVKSAGGVWTLDAFGSGSLDPAAIHDNAAGEINAITEKATPADGDMILIEDSADSYNKKKVQVGNLPGGAGGYTQGARVYHDAAQTIANADATAYLAFNSERYDTDTIHDAVTNNSRLTCKTPGKYLIIGNIELVADADGLRTLNIVLNRTSVIGSMSVSPIGAAGTDRLNVTTIYDLALNDYVELRIYHSAGNNLNVNATANFSPEFMMQRIG